MNEVVCNESQKAGDMIARLPDEPGVQWLVPEHTFQEEFEAF